MSSINWLHISDLHLRIKDDYNSSIVREAFVRDIQKFCSDNGLQLDLIFMTGDIAFSGHPEEYRLAAQFFDQLLAMTQISKDCLFVIPGNHDVSRSDITYIAANISSLLNNRDQVNHLLYSRDSSSVCQRLNNYVQFLRDYFGESVIANAIKTEPYYFIHIRKLAGKTIAVLGLNSAWLSSGDNDRHNLLVGERQVRDVLRKSEEQNVDYTIALMHHPFDWLKDFDADDIQALLMLNCHFILRGHLHQTNIELVSSPDGSAARIAAGALYETREYPNAYNIVHFDPEKGEGTIYFRRYSDRSGGFFAKDTLTYRNVPDGQYNFFLRARTNIPRTQTAATATAPTPTGTSVSDQPEEYHPQPEPPKPDPPPESVVDYPSSPTDEEEQIAISLVKSCFNELMKWKKAVDFAAFNQFAGGETFDDKQYTYQHEFLEKIYNLSSNLNTYIGHLSKNDYARSASLLGTIYNIQTTARLLQIYVTQTNRAELHGEIQPQFKLLSGHFTLLKENFKMLNI